MLWVLFLRDALNSLSGVTGSGKIVDNWLRAFTGTGRAAATLLTLTLYIFSDPVQSGLNLKSRDTMFIPASRRLLVASRDLLKLNHFPSCADIRCQYGQFGRISARCDHFISALYDCCPSGACHAYYNPRNDGGSGFLHGKLNFLSILLLMKRKGYLTLYNTSA